MLTYTAAKSIYDQLLDEKSPLDAFDLLLATLRNHFEKLLFGEEDKRVEEVSFFFLILGSFAKASWELSFGYLWLEWDGDNQKTYC